MDASAYINLLAVPVFDVIQENGSHAGLLCRFAESTQINGVFIDFDIFKYFGTSRPQQGRLKVFTAGLVECCNQQILFRQAKRVGLLGFE